MEFEREIALKDGARCLLRSAREADAEAVIEHFLRAHAETDFLLSDPDESGFDAAQERRFLERKRASSRELMLVAELDGRIAGTAGVDALGEKYKLRHRAEFGISVERAYWGRGIGRALTNACIEAARRAGYAQLELSVVAENAAAIALYRSAGFVEYGRNPLGFRSRVSGDQALVLMRRALSEEART